MGIETIARIAFVYGIGALFTFLGGNRLYIAIWNVEKVSVRPAHEKMLFGGKAGTLGKRVYALVAGLAALLTGLMFIAGVTYLAFFEGRIDV